LPASTQSLPSATGSTASTQSPAQTTGSSAPASIGDGGLSKAALVGAIVGPVVTFLGVLIALFACLKKWLKKKTPLTEKEVELGSIAPQDGGRQEEGEGDDSNGVAPSGYRVSQKGGDRSRQTNTRAETFHIRTGKGHVTVHR